MKTHTKYLFIVVLIIAHGCTTDRRDVYDPADYILTNPQPGKKVYDKYYVYRYDTSRKMTVNYWNNGRVLARSFSYKGRIDGTFKMYDSKGKLMSVKQFDNGKVTSSQDFYEKDTSVKVFNNGKLEPFTDIDQLKH